MKKSIIVSLLLATTFFSSGCLAVLDTLLTYNVYLKCTLTDIYNDTVVWTAEACDYNLQEDVRQKCEEEACYSLELECDCTSY